MAGASVVPKGEYDFQNEFEHREDMARRDKLNWKKNANVIIPYGKQLGFTAPNGNEYIFSVDGDGALTFGVEGESATGLASVSYVISAVSGIEGDVASVTSEVIAARDGQVDLLAKITTVQTAATSAGTAAATAQSEITAARDGETNLLAKINSIDTAIVTGDAANASSITTLTATVGGISSSVTNIAQAYATNSSGTARLIWTVAVGTNVATIEQTAATGYADGTWNGSAIKISAANIILDADAINFGADTTYEDTYNTFYTISGSYRYRDRGPFGASSDILQWFGLNSVSLNSETKTNGVWALGTDGKVYYGATELVNGTGISVVPSNAIRSGSRSGTGNATTNTVTLTVTGGTGSYDVTSALVAGDTFTINTVGTLQYTGTANLTALGQTKTGTYRFAVRDTNTGLVGFCEVQFTVTETT